MSVWQDSSAALSGAEGALLSISIDVDAGDLESLLETLARVSFPINPQIFHDAAVVFVHPDGHRETERATLVEFPAYAGQVEELRRALASAGFDPACMQIVDMLSELQSPTGQTPRLGWEPVVTEGTLRQKVRELQPISSGGRHEHRPAAGRRNGFVSKANATF